MLSSKKPRQAPPTFSDVEGCIVSMDIDTKETMIYVADQNDKKVNPLLAPFIARGTLKNPDTVRIDSPNQLHPGDPFFTNVNINHIGGGVFMTNYYIGEGICNEKLNSQKNTVSAKKRFLDSLLYMENKPQIKRMIRIGIEGNEKHTDSGQDFVHFDSSLSESKKDEKMSRPLFEEIEEFVTEGFVFQYKLEDIQELRTVSYTHTPSTPTESKEAITCCDILVPEKGFLNLHEWLWNKVFFDWFNSNIYKPSEEPLIFTCRSGVHRSSFFLLVCLLLDYRDEIGLNGDLNAPLTQGMVDHINYLTHFLSLYRYIKLSADELGAAVKFTQQFIANEKTLSPLDIKDRTECLSFESIKTKVDQSLQNSQMKRLIVLRDGASFKLAPLKPLSLIGKLANMAERGLTKVSTLFSTPSSSTQQQDPMSPMRMDELYTSGVLPVDAYALFLNYRRLEELISAETQSSSSQTSTNSRNPESSSASSLSSAPTLSTSWPALFAAENKVEQSSTPAADSTILDIRPTTERVWKI